MLGEEPRTYTYLLETLGVESGHLAYHLRHLGDLVEKDVDGVYTLTKLGVEGYRFMERERPPDETRPIGFNTILVYGVAFILVIILSTSTILFSSTTIDNTDLYLDESLSLVERSLDTIYEIFDQRYIKRKDWTDMTITLIKLQDRLEKLDETSAMNLHEAEELKKYVEAFTAVMATPDSMYPDATLEFRPLVREYHFILVQLKPRLIDLKKG